MNGSPKPGLARYVESACGARIYVTRSDRGGVTLESGGTVLSLPPETADSLAALLSPSMASDREAGRSGVDLLHLSVADLVHSGALAVETELSCGHLKAIVVEDGLLVENSGDVHESPEEAYTAGFNSPASGDIWSLWEQSDGETLAHTRWAVRAAMFR